MLALALAAVLAAAPVGVTRAQIAPETSGKPSAAASSAAAVRTGSQKRREAARHRRAPARPSVPRR